jgi:A/G-specific adenine glycosylase
MLCKPRKPLCNECPFTNQCFAFQNNKIEKLPVKSKKIKQQKRYFYYIIVENDQYSFFKQRTGNDIWRNLFDFPLIELENEIAIEELPHTAQWKSIFSNNTVSIVKHSKAYKHVLTHQLITARFIHITIKNEKFLPSYFHKIQKRNIFDLAVPKIIENYLANL